MSKKKGLQITLAFVMTVVMLIQFSCIEDGPKTYENAVVSLTPMNLSLSPGSLSFNTYEASTRTIEVVSTDVAWEFVNIPDWITIKPLYGKGNANVRISCATNEDTKDRMGVFIFRSVGNEWNYSTSVTVSQVRNVYEAIPETDSIGLPYTASQALVHVNANNDVWAVWVENDMKSWCIVIKNNDAVIISCTENTSVKPRSGYMMISTDDGSRQVKITQSAIEMGVKVEDNDSATMYFSDKAGMASIQVNTFPNVPWTVSSSADWITISPIQSTGSGIINVSVTDNTDGPVRTAKIYVKAYDFIQELTVIQNGKYLNVTSPSLSFKSKGGEIMLSFKTNDSWQARTDASWLVLSQREGDGDCNVLLTVADNNSGFSRNGKITITPDVATPMVLNVEQKGRYLVLSDSSAIVMGHGGVSKKRVFVDTDGDYEVTTGSKYITVYKEVGSFIISLTDLDTAQSVQDSVTVSLTGLPSGSSIVKKLAIVVNGINREYVDMGLSVLWASCNVGALSSEEYGDFYAWGDIEPYYEQGYANQINPVWKSGKESGYTWDSYKYCTDGTSYYLNKYCCNVSYGYNGFTDNKRTLDPEDDVASVEWGGSWRMPSINEWAELANANNCTWTWTIKNGIKGYLVTSKKAGFAGNSIFLPAAGTFNGVSKNIGELGSTYYWANNCTDYYAACSFSISTIDYTYTFSDRYIGMSVRPVCPFVASMITGIKLNTKEKLLEVGDNVKLKTYAYKNDNDSVEFSGADWYSNDVSVALVASDGTIQAVGQGSCKIIASFGAYRDSCVLSVLDPFNTTPEYVDLGLSLKWATFNIGASSPGMYGDYFAWGETEPLYLPGYAQSENPKWKEYYSGNPISYDWQGNKYTSGGVTELTKYCYNGGYGKNGFVDNKNVLEPVDDVAYVKWGKNWRIPTYEEFVELEKNCTWEWTVQNGIKGYKITSKKYSDRFIFLPAGGYRSGLSLSQLNVKGRYWSSSLSSEKPYMASLFSFDYATRLDYSVSDDRYMGYTIRPVYTYSADDIERIEISRSELNLKQGDTLFPVSVHGFVADGSSFRINDAQWSSSDESIATVLNGYITAVGKGSCTIIAKYTVSGHTFTAECTVNVTVQTADQVVLTDNIYLLVTDYINGEVNTHVTPRIITDPLNENNKCVIVTTNENPSNRSDAQLLIVSKGELKVGDVLSISFRFRADIPQRSNTGAYSLFKNQIEIAPIGYVNFASEWQTFTYNYTVNNGNTRIFVIDLSLQTDGNNCYFDDISIVSSRTGNAPPEEFASTGTYNNHDYVDLGLSVLWATSNVGAYYYTEPGELYAWGEITPKSSYEWNNYYHKTEGTSFNDIILSKYNMGDWRGVRDDKNVLDPEDDVAHVNWGGNWRMPTMAEFQELNDNCIWLWTTINGVNGYKVTSIKTGYTNRYIFIPVSGYCNNEEYIGLNNIDNGYYWSSSLFEDKATYALSLHFTPQITDYSSQNGRYCGLCIRPVCNVEK